MPQREIGARRQAELIRAEALVVDAVPRFVQHAEEGGGEKPLVVPRGDAAIARAMAATKGMMRDIRAGRGEN